MGNVLERVTVDAYPVIDQIKKMMIKEGALNAMMSGSGPTVFGIFEEKATARKAARCDPGCETDKTGLCDEYTQCKEKKMKEPKFECDNE